MRGNSVSIKGNVTRDAEVRTTKSGNTIVEWGVAWNQRRKTQGGDWEDVPHYFDVKCWMTDRQQQALVPQIVKGASCAIVDAHLVYESWEKDGQKRSRVSVMVDDPFDGMLLRPPAASQAQPPAPQYAPMQQQAPAYAPPQQGYGQQQMPVTAPAVGASMYDEDIPFDGGHTYAN